MNFFLNTTLKNEWDDFPIQCHSSLKDHHPEKNH